MPHRVFRYCSVCTVCSCQLFPKHDQSFLREKWRNRTVCRRTAVANSFS